MKEYRKEGIGTLCGLFGKTRHAYYDQVWHKQRQSMSDAIVLRLVSEIREDLPRLGTRKLYFLLTPKMEAHGISMGRDALFNLLNDHGLLIRQRSRYTKTTNSHHHFRKYGNLIREMVILRPNQVWVTDITYLRLRDCFCYLSLVTDAYSRKILGYCLLRTLQAEGPIRALNMAFNNTSAITQDLIHHSDRGIQYCCSEYTKILTENNVLISMAQNGDPYENAIAERVNGILKTEFHLHRTFENFEAANNEIKVAIDSYNVQRPHASCDYLSPTEAYKKPGGLPKRWKSYAPALKPEHNLV